MAARKLPLIESLIARLSAVFEPELLPQERPDWHAPPEHLDQIRSAFGASVGQRSSLLPRSTALPFLWKEI